ncbi:hypothetical protein GLOIN_2v1792124 [Rhizophagus irregularis DAOM 181602=DAOM 197198]|nr:hypothetical protein GLOIN_2v1792124 [Rhizophagus irregularis DAOM 181602=DAOM 197198]
MEMFDFYDLNDQISVFSDTDSGFKESYDNEEYENNQYEDDFVIDFDEEGYFRALNSLINETDESDIEPDDTESELSEISEPDEDFYQVIGQDTDSKLTSCVLIDYIDGTYRTCGQVNCKKRLRELIGIWQIDSEIVTAVKNDLSKLGVCMSHFNFDQRIHKKKIKSMTKSTEESRIQQRQCLFCHQNHHYFTRGIGCTQHSWVILDRVILTPCIGQIDCYALKESGNFCKSSLKNFSRPRFSCGNCFVDKGGHLYTKPGKGKKKKVGCEEHHVADTSTQLEIIGRWFIRIAKFGEDKFKNKTLAAIAPSIFQILQEIRPTKHTSEPTISESVSEEIPDVPSLFMLHVGMQLKQINIEVITQEDLKDQFCQDLGKQFALKIWKSRIELTLNKNQLQNPQSIGEYVSSFPSWLVNFFYAFLTGIYEKKMAIVNQRRKARNISIKANDPVQITKIVSLFLSILISITFPSLQIWFSTIIASLTRKPKMAGDLTNLLAVLKVLSHCKEHERRLEKERMNKVDPTKRLKKNSYFWNLAVIDNIDFKEKTFSYGNIFDITRGTSHATLRMKILDLYDEILDECLGFYYSNNDHENLQFETNFDISTVHKKLIERMDRGCFGDPQHVVILEAGGIPNTNEGIFNAAKMYKNDFSLSSDEYLDIVADESIFRRLINLRKEWPNLRPILGSWHTNKDMASALISIFSSYGIFDLAAAVGVKYIDKLEKVVDYRATVRIIELIWVSVGIALRIHLKSKNMHKYDIMDDKYEEYQILKIWYLFYNWAGLFIAHRIGIRIGNFNIQKNTLAAFSPLLPSAGKSNYAQSVSHFFGILEQYPKLEEKLQVAGSFKVSEDRFGHFMAFDEALETFGVKFIKQNVTGNVIDQENLKRQVKASQSEYERIELFLNEYLHNNTSTNHERSTNLRKDEMWSLVEKLLIAFDTKDFNHYNQTHDLFHTSYPKEIHADGIRRLKECYKRGLHRIHLIYAQEVLKKEKIDTTGRRVKEVLVTKCKDIEKPPRKRKNTNILDNQPGSSDEPPKKRVRRIPSKEAVEILAPMVAHSLPPTKEEVQRYLAALEGISSSSDIWDAARLTQYYKNRHKKAK